MTVVWAEPATPPKPKRTKRYVTQRWLYSGWEDYKSYRWRWYAIRAAKYGQGLGVLEYRVIDTRTEEN
jgi:hypothetical protein